MKGFSVWEDIPDSFHKDIQRLIFQTLFSQKAKLKMCVSLPLVEGCESGEVELAFFIHRNQSQTSLTCTATLALQKIILPSNV